MRFPDGETVVILRDSPGGTDPYGDPIEGEATETPVEGCAVWTAGSAATEVVNENRDPVTADRVVVMPHGTDVKRTDRLSIRGEMYEVEGIPIDYRHPMTGWTPGVVVYANRGEG